MYKLTVYIPKQDCEKVKNAMFEAGAGRIGNYDCCCFQLEGEGQFRPREGANPHLGTTDRIEYVQEIRVELVVADSNVSAVINAMKKAHPYEEVAFDLIELANQKFVKSDS